MLLLRKTINKKKASNLKDDVDWRRYSLAQTQAKQPPHSLSIYIDILILFLNLKPPAASALHLFSTCQYAYVKADLQNAWSGGGENSQQNGCSSWL